MLTSDRDIPHIRISAAADRLNIPQADLRALIDSGELPSTRFSGRTYIPVSAVEELETRR